MQKKYNNVNITAKKCRERWTCKVNPAIKKGPLSDAEVLLLFLSITTIYITIGPSFPKLSPTDITILLRTTFIA
jgi:hypothetical protein